MEKIKDIFYERSDIFFATLIVSAVVFVVSNSLGGWMFVDADGNKYDSIPSKAVSAEASSDPAANPDQEDQASDTSSDPDASKEAGQTSASEGKDSDNTPDQDKNLSNPQLANSSEVRKVTVAPGSTAQGIADSLKNSNLISDSKTFLQALSVSGKDTRLKAGDFSIPAESSVDEIIDILTR